MEEKMRHLELIQSVISRMASNSSSLKGWTVTLVVGLLAFANLKEMDSNFMFIALIPAGFFWLLDAYYLYMERLYIKLYEHVTTLDNQSIDFSLNAKSFEKEAGGLWSAIISNTLIVFYFPILVIIGIAICFFWN